MKIRIAEWKETLAVKWFMLDAQQKQAVIILSVTILDGIVEIIVARINREKKSNETKSL